MRAVRTVLHGRPLWTAAACLALLTWAGTVLVHHLLPPAVAIPEDSFFCENEHTWKDRVQGAPRCPTCSEPGISRSLFQCNHCDHTFAGMEVKKQGPGSFSYRSVPGVPWGPLPPSDLSCPQCKTTAARDSGTFTGLGYFPSGRPSALTEFH